MAKTFIIAFKNNETLRINDILRFEQKQIDEITAIAIDYTKEQLRDFEEEGKDLSYLTTSQQKLVVRTKNSIVAGKTSGELKKEKIVLISLHSNHRMLERLGSDELSVIISLVDKIVDSDMVLKAQFKGHPTLTYTMAKSNDADEFKLPISFQWKAGGGRIIKMITLTFKGAPPKKLANKIVQDSDTAQRMAEFKRKLVEQSKKKTGDQR